MNLTHKLTFFALFLFLISCSTVKWEVARTEAIKIPIDAQTEHIADKSLQAELAPYKAMLEAEMNVVLGYSPVDLNIRAPESLLSNFSADVYKEVAEDFLKEDIDFSIVNIKGLRAPIPAGNITVSHIFQLMPFENELVIIWMKGEDLVGLFDFFASIKGEGVSGMKMGIQNGKAVDVLINNQPLDLQKVYKVATNDYLAEGNDGMVQLARNIKRIDTGVTVREMLIEYIKKETAAGRNIAPSLDGRIYLIQ